MNRKTTILSLSGGLGNQLFQIMAAYDLNPTANIFLEKETHGPHRDENQQLVSEGFNLVDKIGAIEAPKFPSFVRRTASLNLRFSLKEKKTITTHVLIFISRYVLTYYLFLKYLKKFSVITQDSVDFYPLPSIDKNLYLNGYFQSGKIFSSTHVVETANNIALKTTNPSLEHWIERAKETAPVVLHFRIGDYKLHPGMGVLNIEYFMDCIKALHNTGLKKEIWIFSDEPEIALNQLPIVDNSYFRIVPPFSPSETLELMRYGAAYIISNSTFGWWGAALKYDEHASVWAPQPWFRFQKSPTDIYLSDWNLVHAWQPSVSDDPFDEPEVKSQ